MADQSWLNPKLISPVILLKGAETVFSSRAFNALKKQALELDPNIEIETIDPKFYKKGDLYMYTSPSLFSQTKLVDINDLETLNDELLADLLEYITKPESDVYLILRHNGAVRGKKLIDAIKKQNYPIIACDSLKSIKDKTNLVIADVRANNRKIANDAATALVEALGSDLAELLSATNQLLHDIDGEITIEAVNRYYGGRKETNGYNIADAIVAAQEIKAMSLMRHALQNGVSEVSIVSAVANKIRTVVKVKALISRRLQPSSIGMAPWQVNQIKDIAYRWDDEALAKAISAVADADYGVKGGSKEPEYVLEKMLMDICTAYKQHLY